jgi:glycosyltransferase involved in cell wall biosynthesis
LFSGSLDQRAGLAYLFRACRELGSSVTLTVIGTPPSTDCPALMRELTRVRWLPTWSQAVIRQEMAAHDVFLHPSVFDTGSCMLLEALSMGLPIVATTHSAAPDLISDGREGFIIPPRSSADIVDRLALLVRDPDLRAAMAHEARQRADSFTWQRFEKTIAATVGAAIGMR